MVFEAVEFSQFNLETNLSLSHGAYILAVEDINRSRILMYNGIFIAAFVLKFLVASV